MFLGWSQIFNTKIATQTFTIRILNNTKQNTKYTTHTSLWLELYWALVEMWAIWKTLSVDFY